VDARDPDLPVARKIGAAIATALLLQPREHVIGENVAGESLDNLYQVFLGTCDLYLGFKLIPDAYPEWMKLTRPYYRASYVFAAIDAGWRALADMPKSRAIGATMGTGADLRLIQYLQALTPAERWSRFPMSSDEAALKALMSGTVGIALVWGPTLWALQRSDAGYAKLRLLLPSPLPAASADVGAAVLANESFLRNSVDQAIAALTSDGTIQSILDGNKFPATAVK
jgi:polar amino acid transport system substrate-binding protein